MYACMQSMFMFMCMYMWMSMCMCMCFIYACMTVNVYVFNMFVPCICVCVHMNAFINIFMWTECRNGYCFKNVATWTKNVDLFAKDILLVPINIDNEHWAVRSKFFQVCIVCSYITDSKYYTV